MQSPDTPVVSRFVMEIVMAFAMMLFGLTVIYGALELDIGWSDGGPQSGYVPFYLGCILCLTALGILLQTLRDQRNTSRLAFVTRTQLKRIIQFLLPIILYIVASLFLGLYVASTLYLASVMVVQGGYGPVRSVAVGVLTSAFFFVLFEIWFRIPLLKGPLEAALGIY